MSHPETNEDACSCRKPDGCWGAHGWHFYALKPAGDLYPETYTGTPVAYERCPHFVAAAERYAAERKRAQAATTWSAGGMAIVDNEEGANGL